MKTTKKLMLILLSIWAFSAQAQIPCGITQPYYYSAPNPNNVPVFHDTSMYASGWQPISYFWDFGDGATSTQAAPSHVFGPGNFNVCMTVTAQLQGTTTTCSQTYCKLYSNCNGMVVATYNALQQGNGVVTFNGSGSSNYPPLSFAWDFGDSTTGTGANPVHTYMANGTYTACLYVSDTNGCSASYCQTIQITSANPCGNVQSSFTATSDPNGLVSLHSTSTNILSGSWYQWWMDGNIISVTSAGLSNFSVNNVASGSHQFCLYIYSPQNSQYFCDSSCQTLVVNNSNPCAGLTSTWSVLQHQGNVYSLGAANNTTSGIVHIWSVNGTPVATSQNHTYTFPSSPSTVTYNVCHKVQISGTTCIDSTCQNITVTGSGTACSGVAAAITQTVDSNGISVLTGVYTGGNPVSYNWSNGATTQSMTVNALGYYCVTITDANSCSAVACDTANGNGCFAQFAATSLNCNQVLFDDYSAGNYNSVIWYYGDGSSDTTVPQSSVVHTYANGGVWTVMIELVGGTCDGTTGYNIVYPQACYTDTICGTIFNDVNGNGVQDGGETGVGYGYITAGNYIAYIDSFGHYTINLPAGTYNIYYCAPTGYTYTIPVTPTSNPGVSTCTAYTNVTVSGGGIHCGYDFGIQNTSVTICGTVYFDANNSGTQDLPNENGINGVHVYIAGNGGSFHAYTDAQGHYCVTLPAGTYTVTTTSNTFQSCVSAPATLSVAATTVGTSYYNNNFAIYCQPGACNLAITITPHTTVTAGFPAWYDIQVCNVGSSISSGTVNMFYDNALTFDYASPVQTSHNASTHTVSWALNNLLPGDCEYYWVNFDALTNIQLNQFVFTLANVTPGSGCNDINMNNNVDTIHQAVTGSWDPNNKLAYVTNYESDPTYQQVSAINANQRIEYVVNFQNTGNSPAVNVVVLDELSADIDENSFEFLGGSHACNVTRDGKKLNFKFTNIMLADSTNNEPQSHGFVKFAVNAVNGLPGGHVISDDAAIYFDYNAAVITNDAAVILLDASGMEEVVVSTTVVIAPNPMSTTAEIRVKGNSQPFIFRVTDMTGRLVSETRSEGTNLLFERNSLSAGMYTYQILQNNKPAANGKLVIE